MSQPITRSATYSGASSSRPPPAPRMNPLDPFQTRVTVLVDDATEPGVSDESAARIRRRLTNIILENDKTIPRSATNISGGAAVETAIRKRLKSDDEQAVLNTITLLDELMRTVPFFYRFIANERFFRRLWRFVVPDYKNNMLSVVNIFGKPKMPTGVVGNVASERVRILIRAWAQDLSVMFQGRYDPSAGFLIERYQSKRSRTPFPPLPETNRPWVCPIDTNVSSSSSSSRAHRITLAEVENTVELFANIVDNATTISDLKEDACIELARRGKAISENMTNITMNMNKEEQLAKAISLSEILQKTLATYRDSLDKGEIVKPVPTVDSISLHSEEDQHPANRTRSLSMDRMRSRDISESRVTGQSSRYSDSSEYSSGERGSWTGREVSTRHASMDKRPDEREKRKMEADRERKRRELDHMREARRREDMEREREEANRQRDLERRNKIERRRERDPERRRDGDREKRDADRERVHPVEFERAVSMGTTFRRSEALQDRKRHGKIGSDKRSRSMDRLVVRRREKSDSDLASLKKGKKKSPSNDMGLIDFEDDDDDSGDESSDSADSGENAASFALLASRYSSQKGSKKPKSKPKTKSKSKSKTKSPSTSSQETPPNGQPQQQPQANPQQPGMPNMINPAAMYASNNPMAYNPMMMLPNPYAMYGSVAHMPMADPMGMYSAYQTMNPAMYYSTVNPQMYNPGMMGVMPQNTAPASSPPAAQPPAEDKSAASRGPAETTREVPQAALQQTPQPTMAPPAHPSPVTSLQRQNSAQMANPQPMMPMASPGSFYNSVGGVSPMMSGMMGDGTMGQPMFPSVNPGMPGMNAGTQDLNNPAAAYQTAMHQAAIAYNTAANMYRSVQGQQPLGTPVQPNNMPPPVVPSPMQQPLPPGQGMSTSPPPLANMGAREGEK